MTTPPESISLRLRARRVELGLTLAQVAERAELSLAYVSNLERGRGNPTIDALRCLSGALDLPLSSLVSNEAKGSTVDLILGDLPKSLLAYSRTEGFASVVAQLAERQNEPPETMRQRILVGMASAPRRSSGEPTEDDWRRLLDAYSLIL
jgi:transcriptional regulator with XRE-family HTH domain